jgi:hypothetical protein
MARVDIVGVAFLGLIAIGASGAAYDHFHAQPPASVQVVNKPLPHTCKPVLVAGHHCPPSKASGSARAHLRLHRILPTHRVGRIHRIMRFTRHPFRYATGGW